MFLLWIVYREIERKGSTREPDPTFANTCLAPSVGKWSARTGENTGSLIPYLALLGPDSCVHNPEVVGCG